MVEGTEPEARRERKKGARGRPSNKHCGLDGTGLKFRGPASWQRVRFHKHDRVRDHRKLSLLVGVRQCVEKFVYDWRLTTRRIGEVRTAPRLLERLPANTEHVVLDPAYDARAVYELIDGQEAEPIIKPRANARRTELNARGRAIRAWHRARSRSRRLYRRRVLCESVNSAFKRRFGQGLRTKTARRHDKEVGWRIIAYNTNMVGRAYARRRFTRG